MYEVISLKATCSEICLVLANADQDGTILLKCLLKPTGKNPEDVSSKLLSRANTPVRRSVPLPLKMPGFSATPNTEPSSHPSSLSVPVFTTFSSAHSAQQLSFDKSGKKKKKKGLKKKKNGCTMLQGGCLPFGMLNSKAG